MRQTIAATALGGLVFLGGCSINPRDWSARSQTDDPLLFDVAGPVAVDVESFNGDVTIRGNPEISQAQVTIERKGLHGRGRAKEAKASLADINYSAQIVPGELGPMLQVRTSSSNPEPHYQRANLLIELPDVEGLTVHTTNGKVRATNIRGLIDIATTEDDVRIMTNQPLIKPVTIVNRNGDIDYRVRGESTGRFHAQTVSGQVHHFVRYGTFVVQPPTRSDVLQAVLNGGTNSITLRSVNGDIRIAVVNNPQEIGHFIVE